MFDPFIASMIAGSIWPLIQAALDRPYWTPTRRRALVLCAGLILSILVWWQSAYPLSWQQITAQAAVIIGAAQTGFTILKSITVSGVSIIDWAGIVTPGGQTYTPRHAAAKEEA